MRKELESGELKEILKSAGLKVQVDVTKLKKLLLPVVGIPLEKLMWHFDLPVWSQDGTTELNLTPWDVIQENEGSETQFIKVEQANMDTPIIVTEYQSRVVIIDGLHKVVNAFLSGQKRVKAKMVSLEILNSESGLEV